MKNNYKTRKSLGSMLLSFIRSETFSGIFLFISMVLALLTANSSFAEQYFSFWHYDFGFTFNDYFIGFDIQHWVNDVLMSFFFLMVGLEIKREFLIGELSGLQKAIFPVVAAIGGMIVPALIYISLNVGTNSIHGFGIPMATDIAFALGIILMLGKKIPSSLKVFLVTLAVVDDLGAVIVIAIFYTNEIFWSYLALSLGIVALLILLNKMGVKNLVPYLLLGVVLWIFVHKSGVHSTVSAVILAFCIPLKARGSKVDLLAFLRDGMDKIYQKYSGDQWGDKPKKALKTLYKQSKDFQSPLEVLEHKLHPWSAYFIMPLFAFANAGVNISNSINFGIDHIFLGVLLGLFLGKPMGILFATYICSKLKIATKPSELSWTHILGAGILSGIGFTMSIFVSNLAFDNQQSVEIAKIAVLLASLLSAIVGSSLLILFNKLKTK
ncbi:MULTISPECIES: sodium/proton antiporter NhaA [unclassified Helicobacter]|uniref:sodium/proton antiporter NhaA n=1 Tax=unclassified Helicobacter TaxID=2593540 RepID=UPI000CF05202|nr:MULTISPECIES: sodium/proton antiporter NhaA [unclassified Helicobacter]